jgi:hypothetical protein
MPVGAALLQQATRARDRFVAAQHEADRAQVSYQDAIRKLHASGASLREIADALGLSYQRVHQIVDPTSGKGARKAATAGGGLRLLWARPRRRGARRGPPAARRTHDDRDCEPGRPEGALRVLRQATKPG